MERIGNGDWDDSIEAELGDSIAEAIDDFGPDFDAEGNPIEEGESDRIKSEERAKPGRLASEDQETEEQEQEEREKEPARA